MAAGVPPVDLPPALRPLIRLRAAIGLISRTLPALSKTPTPQWQASSATVRPPVAAKGRTGVSPVPAGVPPAGLGRRQPPPRPASSVNFSPRFFQLPLEPSPNLRDLPSMTAKHVSWSSGSSPNSSPGPPPCLLFRPVLGWPHDHSAPGSPHSLRSSVPPSRPAAFPGFSSQARPHPPHLPKKEGGGCPIRHAGPDPSLQKNRGGGTPKCRLRPRLAPPSQKRGGGASIRKPVSSFSRLPHPPPFLAQSAFARPPPP